MIKLIEFQIDYIVSYQDVYLYVNACAGREENNIYICFDLGTYCIGSCIVNFLDYVHRRFLTGFSWYRDQVLPLRYLYGFVHALTQANV